MAPPKRLFRYFDPTASDIFTEGKLWFSSAKDFNDIFEVVPSYARLVTGQVEDALKKEFAFSCMKPGPHMDWQDYKREMAPGAKAVLDENLEMLPEAIQKKFSEHFGIVCFSANGESPLMWGHYTKCHQGFVVEFNPSHSIFDPGDLAKIDYSESRPCAAERDYRKILLTKSTAWTYEEEYRLIKPFQQLTLGRRRDGMKKYYMPLPLEAVSAVYFGVRIEDAARDEILHSLSITSARHINPYIMRRHRTDYKLVAVPWDEWQPPSPAAAVDLDGLWPKFGF